MMKPIALLLAASAAAVVRQVCSGQGAAVGECGAYTDVVLVVDSSVSVADVHDNLTDVMRSYVNAYALSVTHGATIGIVEFRGCNDCTVAESATVLNTLSANRATLLASIDARGPSENQTCMSCGLEVAENMLLVNNRSGAMPLVVLISDGVQVVQGGPDKAISVASRLKASGIRVVTHSFGGADVDEGIYTSTMHSIASIPSGTYARGDVGQTVFQLQQAIPESVSVTCTQVAYGCWLSGYCEEAVSFSIHGRGFVNSTDLRCRVGGVLGSP